MGGLERSAGGGSGAERVAVIGDASPFNRRLISAVVELAGYDDVVQVGRVQDLLHSVTMRQPELVVFDPRLDHDAGFAAIEEMRVLSPSSVVVAFTGTDWALEKAKDAGVVALRRVSIFYWDGLHRVLRDIERGDITPTIVEEEPVAAVASPFDEAASLIASAFLPEPLRVPEVVLETSEPEPALVTAPAPAPALSGSLLFHRAAP